MLPKYPRSLEANLARGDLGVTHTPAGDITASASLHSGHPHSKVCRRIKMAAVGSQLTSQNAHLNGDGAAIGKTIGRK